MKFIYPNEDGATYMVDVTTKNPTVHQANAVCRVDCSPKVMQALRDGTVPKSDILVVARVAGISAAKRTPELLPLAHTIGTYGCAVDLSLEDDHVAIRVTVRTADRTGVGVEALASVTMAVLATVDMVKDTDRSARTREAKVVVRLGGRSGDWMRPEDPQT